MKGVLWIMKKMEINFDNEPSFSEKYNVEIEVIQRTKIISQLTKLREEAGLSQKDLGKKINVTQAQISKIESGLQSPRLDTLLKLANFFKKEITLSSK